MSLLSQKLFKKSVILTIALVPTIAAASALDFIVVRLDPTISSSEQVKTDSVGPCFNSASSFRVSHHAAHSTLPSPRLADTVKAPITSLTEGDDEASRIQQTRKRLLQRNINSLLTTAREAESNGFVQRAYLMRRRAEFLAALQAEHSR